MTAACRKKAETPVTAETYQATPAAEATSSDMGNMAMTPLNAAPIMAKGRGTVTAIDKAAGGDAESYDEMRYEGYGPGGVAIIVEALTDNRNRTATNVRTAFSKNGGNLGASGAVSHGFDRRGLITYPASAGDADSVFEAALEAGAEDVESNEDEHSIWTSMEALHEVAKALEATLGAAESAKLAWKPQLLVEVDEANAATLLKMIDALEDDDDVQTVWGNYDVSDEVMAKLG